MDMGGVQVMDMGGVRRITLEGGSDRGRSKRGEGE